MAQPVTAKLDDDQVDYLKEKVECGEAGSISEAVRSEIDHGNATNTALRRMLRRTADSTTFLGVFWVGLTFVYPLEFRAFAIPIFAVALALYISDRVLEGYEPAFSRRLFGLFRREVSA